MNIRYQIIGIIKLDPAHLLPVKIQYLGTSIIHCIHYRGGQTLTLLHSMSQSCFTCVSSLRVQCKAIHLHFIKIQSSDQNSTY